MTMTKEQLRGKISTLIDIELGAAILQLADVTTHDSLKAKIRAEINSIQDCEHLFDEYVIEVDRIYHEPNNVRVRASFYRRDQHQFEISQKVTK